MIDGQVDRQIGRHVYWLTDKTNRRMDKQTARHMTDRQLDSQTDRQIDRQTDSQIDRVKNTKICRQIHLYYMTKQYIS